MRTLLLGALILTSVACSSGSSAPEPGANPSSSVKATLTADPNPVPAGPGWGTSTIKWDTGDGSWGQVYLFVQGQPDVLFVEGPSGTKAAPWISGGAKYEFRLFAGKDHKIILASVDVTRSQN